MTRQESATGNAAKSASVFGVKLRKSSVAVPSKAAGNGAKGRIQHNTTGMTFKERLAFMNSPELTTKIESIPPLGNTDAVEKDGTNSMLFEAEPPELEEEPSDEDAPCEGHPASVPVQNASAVSAVATVGLVGCGNQLAPDHHRNDLRDDADKLETMPDPAGTSTSIENGSVVRVGVDVSPTPTKEGDVLAAMSYEERARLRRERRKRETQGGTAGAITEIGSARPVETKSRKVVGHCYQIHSVRRQCNMPDRPQ